tara:strand:- start:6782 stop:8527 length:1746 start_codon:yes stop_codon:yes gene_type:complete
MTSLRKILFLIDYKINILIILLFLFILISLFEIVSLALLTPFLTLLADNSNFDNLFLKYFISFENLNRQNLIIIFGFLILGMIILKSIITIFCWYLVYYFTWQNVINLRIKLIDIYKNIKYEKYISKTSTEYIQNITVLSGNFTKQILLPLMQLVSDLILTLSIAIFLLLTDIYIFLSLSILLLIFSFTFGFFLKKKLLYYGKAINENAIKVLNGVKNLFQGFKEVKIYNKSDYFRNSIISSSLNIAKYQVWSQVFNRLPKAILEIVIAFVTISIVFIYFILNQYALSEILPKLVIFVIAAMRIGPAVASMNVSLNSLKLGKFSLDKMYNELSELDNYKFNSIEKKKLKEFNNISFINVSYSYPNSQKFALNDISFKISKGDTIGIFGSSGSGKTTCIDLLLGFLEPTKGKIEVNDDLILSNSNIDSFQNIIGYIPQDIFIINDTILNNIKLNDDNNPNIYLDKAIKTARLVEFIKNQEKGINSLLGDSGINISGGQRQRISLARALFHNKEILVLDEATNALDETNERSIIEDINLMKKDKTIIIISHNSKILDICDKIIVLDNGRVKNIDTYKKIFNEN